MNVKKLKQMDNIYTEDGWLDMPAIIELNFPFTFIIGARGVGKTYGALKYMITHDINHLLLRRSNDDFKIISRDDGSPYAELNSDLCRDITVQPVNAHLSSIFNGVRNEKEMVEPEGDSIGYIASLAGLAHIRGFNFYNVKKIVYDEFIPEEHLRPIRNEAEAFFNMYETVCRNRELKGEEAVQCICLANSNRADNPIFMELGLTNKIVKMQNKGQQIFYDVSRGILVIDCQNSPISDKKKNTALGRLTAGTSFAGMAYDNRFMNIDDKLIKSMPLEKMTPVCSWNNLYLYKAEAEDGRWIWFLSTHKTGNFTINYQHNKTDDLRFVQKYNFLLAAILRGRIFFESYEVQQKFFGLFL